jgi:hypothetical protein
MSRIRILVAAALASVAVQAQAVGSLVDLAVHDRTENVRLPVYWHAGRAWVAGKPGNEYSVSVRNRQGADVLAVVSVDGVNVVSGETAHPLQTGYVLSPQRALDIKGWRKNMAETAAFYFTSLPDSYAARTGRPGDVGVIGVAVFRKKHVEPPQPISRIAPSAEKSQRDDAARNSGELASGAGARAQAAPSSPIATGHGRREESRARHVGFERASNDPAEVVTLHYDSRANLVAMGVIREPVHIAPRPPRPFPGFVPDPVSGSWPLPEPSLRG